MGIKYEFPFSQSLQSGFELVSFLGKYDILTKKPLIELKTPGGTAYEISGRDDCFAYVSDTNFPLNFSQLSVLQTINNSSTLKILDYGSVKWLNDGTYQFVVIMEKPIGQRVMQPGKEPARPLNQNLVERSFIRPTLAFLAELDALHTCHGNIRADNLFYEKGVSDVFSLGESFMLPDLYAQSVLYLPVDKAASYYAGRGEGSMADDVYAFGITIVVLITGHVPMFNFPIKDLLKLKIERGSFSAMTRSSAFPSSMNELLRGMLADDPESRWTVEEIQSWFAGNRQNPRQFVKLSKSARLFDYEGRHYSDAKSLATSMAMHVADNPSVGLKIFEDGSLMNWLLRSFTDQSIYKNVLEAIGGGAIKSKYDVLLFAKIFMSMDKSLPIYYGEIAVYPTGMGTTLTDLFVLNKNPVILLEMIRARLLQRWLSAHNNIDQKLQILVQNFDHIMKYAEKSEIGLGIERVLYELNPNMYCLSPKVSLFKPRNNLELLSAFEERAKDKNFESEVFDRHLLAFILTKHKGVDNYYLSKLETTAPIHERAHATAYLLGEIAVRNNISALPHLCEWIVFKLEEFIEKLHNAELKVSLRKQLAQFSKEGDLVSISSLVGSTNIVESDQENYNIALKNYEDIENNIFSLQAIINNPSVLIQTIGRHVASAISTLCACIIGGTIILKVILEGG